MDYPATQIRKVRNFRIRITSNKRHIKQPRTNRNLPMGNLPNSPLSISSNTSVYTNDKEYKEKSKNYYEQRKHVRNSKLKVGDKVMYKCKRHHQVVLARTVLTLTFHPVRSNIAAGSSSLVHPESSLSWSMYVRAGLPLEFFPCFGCQRSKSLMQISFSSLVWNLRGEEFYHTALCWWCAVSRRWSELRVAFLYTLHRVSFQVALSDDPYTRTDSTVALKKLKVNRLWVGGSEVWNITFFVLMYLFGKFPLFSAPFDRIEKSFTVGPKKADMFGLVGVVSYMERTWKSKKYWILGTPRPSICLNVLEMNCKWQIHEFSPFSLPNWSHSVTTMKF